MNDLSTVASAYGLSPAEAERLKIYDAQLLQASSHTNLIARSTLPQRFGRHYADSFQLWEHVPNGASTLLDIGSGAGFPGLLLALLAEDRMPGLHLTLCDSVGKKAAFLASTAQEMGLSNVTVTAQRAEALDRRFDIVSARAVTALPRLLDLAVPRVAPNGHLILPKGRNSEEELAEARKRWTMNAKRVQSHTDPEATILLLSNPEPRR
ncbi:16S rRNA (guanine(527)-N(7))-methyltransferase RsmG [Parvularcula oceani]|uniref:16S rRNA (guanine(527)-N(7))-methyltransferase RsmG n=1 Tax=Parvularcula oceani TaxID=1247963 RepID=UPI0004E0F63B|nr:16S rRNA (guanine(527)-N(7))-methyltransferase RsmG [Parvularcula oceani]